MPVFVAFTCDEARALFSEAQPTALTMKGFELFPPLVSVNPGSLLLNPGFRFGGELYLMNSRCWRRWLQSIGE